MTESNGGWGKALAEVIVADLHRQQAPRITREALIAQITDADSQERLLVVQTTDGTWYRLGFHRTTKVLAISKWRADRWSRWYPTELSNPRPGRGIHSTRWVTGPIRATEFRRGSWSPGQ